MAPFVLAIKVGIARDNQAMWKSALGCRQGRLSLEGGDLE